MVEQGVYALAMMVWCFIGANQAGDEPRRDIGSTIFLSILGTIFALRGLWLLVKGLALRDLFG